MRLPKAQNLHDETVREGAFFLEAHQFQWFYEPIFDPVMYTSKGYLRLGGGGTTIFARIFTFKNKMEGARRVVNSTACLKKNCASEKRPLLP